MAAAAAAAARCYVARRPRPSSLPRIPIFIHITIASPPHFDENRVVVVSTRVCVCVYILVRIYIYICIQTVHEKKYHVVVTSVMRVCVFIIRAAHTHTHTHGARVMRSPSMWSHHSCSQPSVPFYNKNSLSTPSLLLLLLLLLLFWPVCTPRAPKRIPRRRGIPSRWSFSIITMREWSSTPPCISVDRGRRVPVLPELLAIYGHLSGESLRG